MTCYMAVSNDNLELPLTPPMSARELAKLLGIREDTVKWYSRPSAQKRINAHTRANKKYKIVSVKMDDD